MRILFFLVEYYANKMIILKYCLFINTKSHQDIKSHPGANSIPCNNYKMKYIGETAKNVYMSNNEI